MGTTTSTIVKLNFKPKRTWFNQFLTKIGLGCSGQWIISVRDKRDKHVFDYEISYNDLLILLDKYNKISFFDLYGIEVNPERMTDKTIHFS